MASQPRLFPEHPIMQRVKDALNTDTLHFDGKTYEPKHDRERLAGQTLLVFNTMRGGGWFTLEELHQQTGAPHASISARMRDFRKEKFGGHQVDRRPRGDRSHGLFEYRLLVKI